MPSISPSTSAGKRYVRAVAWGWRAIPATVPTSMLYSDQPQVDLQTGHIFGVEPLTRWQHPEPGMISPINFIPLAEETGLIGPIGDWVLNSACRQNKAWQKQDAGLPPIVMTSAPAIPASAR